MSELADRTTEARDAIRRFIDGALAVPRLRDDDHLFTSGYANSLFAVQLMTFIEKRFGLEMGLDDLDIENFKSVDAATAFVLRKQGGAR
ncbi:MAG TPA: acyl carrier protein [Casimicrobiaceae bacterium]|nr:acyl carrier protein [Casimicrobiaceae bacterium]